MLQSNGRDRPAIGPVLRRFEEGFRHKQGPVDIQVGHVKKEGLVLIGLNKSHRFFGVTLRDSSLVWLFLNHRFIPPQAKSRMARQIRQAK